MPTTLIGLELLGGFVYLLMGGDLLIRGAMALARTARISPMVVGLTVVALGTSAPELVVSLQAALTGYPEIAIANVVGSNIANVFLVLGIPALIFPLAFTQKSARSDSIFMWLVSAGFFGLCLDGRVSRADGFILLSGLILFLALQVRAELQGERKPRSREPLPIVLGLPNRRWTIALLIVTGAIMLPLGANLLIDGAVGLAERLHVSNQVIGLTVIALSTSIPELATTLVAAFKRQADVAVGNVIGSNILNMLGIMGAASLASLRELTVSHRFLVVDLPMMFVGASLITLVALRRGSMGRRWGIVLVGSYATYILLLYATGR
jgi:cation:H+ antiporter